MSANTDMQMRMQHQKPHLRLAARRRRAGKSRRGLPADETARSQVVGRRGAGVMICVRHGLL